MITSPSGKKYIGKTVQPFDNRMYRHVWNAKNNVTRSCRALYNAIRKYGVENFKFEILLEINDKFLAEYETKFILTYNTLSPNGYNLVVGNNEQISYSDESKKKMSDSQKEYIKNNQEKALAHLRKNGQTNKKNKDLPMYVTEVFKKDGEISAYQIFRHPNNKSGKRGLTVKVENDLVESFSKVLNIYKELNEINKQDYLEENHLMGVKYLETLKMNNAQRLDVSGSSNN